MMVLALLLTTALAAGGDGFPAPDCSLVPGWTQKGSPRTFEPDTLFDYMNGNAEGYHAYGFALMKGVTCVNDAGDELVIDVSELGDADHAWGIYTANRDIRSPNEAIGAAGQVLPRRATFARGRYYVEIAASPAGDHTEALRAFTSALEAQTPGRASPPEGVGWFPEEGLEADSVRLVPASVLGIRALRSGFLAQYPEGRAFVVAEGSPEAASATLETVRERFEGTADAEGIGDTAFTATDDYLGGLVLFRKGAYVAGIANLAEGVDGTGLARRLADRLPSS
ncbi:MAG: hypothetical protein LJF30_03885 [Acidobacteria bacterium]|nr:hypothetical protein [Acidobacteriota bacterium]